MSYAELQCTSHFSFLRGASSCEELFATAAHLGLPALGVTDRNSVAGLVRAHEAAKVTGVRAVMGCRLDLECGSSLLVYPEDKSAWSRLTRLLTRGKSRAGKGACRLAWEDLAEDPAGLHAVLLGDVPGEAMAYNLGRLRDLFGERARMAMTRRFLPDEHDRLFRIAGLARAARVRIIATNDVLYHAEPRRLLQDVVTCIREGCTIDALGRRRERSAGRWLKPPEEMARLFADWPEAAAETAVLADACRFSLSELEYQYPDEVGEDGLTAQQALERHLQERLPVRYPAGVPEKVSALIRHELSLIEELGYAPYFLTVYAIVKAARRMGILCQGRGSAANSAVCFVLGITAIRPERGDLLFERFVSRERGEPPDIDIDFASERREEILQWIYEHYGRDRSALTATVIRYRARGAVREVGKALGLPEDVTAALAKTTWAWDQEGVTEDQVRELNLNKEDRRLKMTLELARQLMGTPRHLSQHPGGFVLTMDRLYDLVPIEPAAMENRQVIEWDKDDIDALGFMKVDCLGLGMLSAMQRFFDLLKAHKGIGMELATIPQDDASVYDMICEADTIGVFQIESRAQMAMLPRMRPRTLDDLTVEVAVVRPGPIQGQMVHPYLKRRQGLEPVEYPTPEFKEVLKNTLGIPLFQEQAMAIAIRCAGFTPGEADQLRRAMATFKQTGGVSHFKERLIRGMIERGFTPDFAERTFSQLEGFGSYGFPMSHAASFAIIAYASSWAKKHHPDAFLAALLNAQPMGFYAPAQLVWDARRHGVEVRPVDVNHSRWDTTLEERAGRSGHRAVRLGLGMVSGLKAEDASRLIGARYMPYEGPEELMRRARISGRGLDRLCEADAFSSCALTRRGAGWRGLAAKDAALPLFETHGLGEEPHAYEPPPMSQGREVVEDYVALGLSLKAHPVSFLRRALSRKRAITAADIAQTCDGAFVRVAGLVLARQRPGSAKGVMFLTLEDETGPVNVIVWPSLFERFRRIVFSAGMMGVEGKLQKEGDVHHVIASRLVDMTAALRRVGEREEDVPLPHGRGDEARGGGGPDKRGVHDQEGRLLPKAKEDYSPDAFHDRPHDAEPPVIDIKARNFR